MTPSPTYIDTIRADLSRRIPAASPAILDLYVLLVLTTGIATTRRDVHAAWTIWASRAAPLSRWLVPFDEVPENVQRLDDPLVDMIREIAAERLTS